jgi:L-glyceraldehyde 3-phosphate reductase
VGSSGGVAERIIGKAVKKERNNVILTTKVGMKVGSRPEDDGTSPSAIAAQLDRSLKNLDTGYLDIYYLHRPDPFVPMAEIIGALDDEICKGKIRYYGISNYSSSQLIELIECADKNNLPRPVICQPALSLLKQEALEKLIPLCVKENIGVAPYQIFQGGLLTGKYKRGLPLPQGSRKAEKSEWMWEMNDELFDKLEAIEAEAKAQSLSMKAYAVKWILERAGIVSAILGVRRIEHLADAIKGVD